ncbi:MAG: hypothetical protein ACKOEZ_04420 [Spartobacteria bacterium]
MTIDKSLPLFGIDVALLVGWKRQSPPYGRAEAVAAVYDCRNR